MSFILQTWQLFFLVLSAWVNRYQQQTIDFYISQTKALLECQGKKRILLSDDQRRLPHPRASSPILAWPAIEFGGNGGGIWSKN